MSLLIESTVKISLLVSLALLTTRLLSDRSAALRHWILAAALLSAVAVPALIAFAPSWSLPVRSAGIDRQTRRPNSIGTTVTFSREARAPTGQSIDVPPGGMFAAFDVAGLLQFLWLAGVGLNLGILLVGVIRLRYVSSRARAVHEGPWAVAARRVAVLHGLRRPVRLLQSNQPALLVTWGLFSPKIMLPSNAESWAEDRIHVVLAHELAHVRRADWAVQLGGELLRSLYWFNPLVWIACARLREESEHACDDAVVNLGVEADDYATHLLELAREFGCSRQAAFPAIAITPRPSSLQRRVSAMLNRHLNRRPLTAMVRVATALALVAVVLPVALFAQNAFSTVSGTIVDESNGLLPGVWVVATDTQRGVRHEVQTDRTGRFELVGLPQGAYTLEASLPGFEAFQQTLSLSGQDVNRDITMKIGSLEELVVVSDGPSNGSDLVRFQRRAPNCDAAGDPAAGRNGGDPRIGGQIRQPTKLRHVAPRYASGSGIVTMDAVIGIDGYVKDVKVTNSAPPDLAQSAVEAVRQWEFDETLLNCIPVEVRMTVTVEFR